jgi:hypothetical protein
MACLSFQPPAFKAIEKKRFTRTVYLGFYSVFTQALIRLLHAQITPAGYDMFHRLQPPDCGRTGTLGIVKELLAQWINLGYL